MSKIYLAQNVFDAALDRINRLHDEFPEIVVCFSGGKDSTVILNLTLQVAEARNRLPVNVLWLDQEAEWENVVTYVRSVMSDPRVKPYWFQGPFKVFNATSGGEPWLYCWKEGAEWIREKEPGSIHDNLTGCDRFQELFFAVSQVYFQSPRAQISGVRCEESPGRFQGLTSSACFKDITWGTAVHKKADHYAFYPLYDWSWIDVWKAIHDNGWEYCPLYDFMWQHGRHPSKMRISNVHHETAIHDLKFLQEIEPHTWDKISSRVSGVNAVSKVWEAYEVPKQLPPMFADWTEYRDYLVDNLIEDEEIRTKFHRQFKGLDVMYLPELDHELRKAQISAVLVNDYHGTKLGNFQSQYARYAINAGSRNDPAITGVQ